MVSYPRTHRAHTAHTFVSHSLSQLSQRMLYFWGPPRSPR